MRRTAIAFLCGTLILLRLPELPDSRWCLLLVCLTHLLLFAARLRFLIVLGCCFLLALCHASSIVSSAIPVSLEGRDLTAIGTIAKPPRLTATGSRFDFSIEHLYADSRPVDFTGNIRLAWYRHQDSLPQAGERWWFRLRLKHPHGSVTPAALIMKHGCYKTMLLPRDISETITATVVWRRRKPDLTGRRVIDRYQQQGSRIWQTDRAGAISVTLIPGRVPLVNGYREQVERYGIRSIIKSSR